MEIDHFDPSLKGAARHAYDNLFLATRHCNGSKSNAWPSRAERRKGLYLLNPCKVLDYGLHIFEHPITHRLIGVSPAGDYHITACDLNARHLVDERRERALILDLLENIPISVKASVFSLPLETSRLLREQLEKMIPAIPLLPKEHRLYEEDLALVWAIADKSASSPVK